MKAFFFKIVGVAFAVLGSLMLLSTLLNLEMIPDELNKWLGMLFIMSLLPLGIGVLLMRKGQQISKDKTYRDYEAKIIAIAQNQSGKITIADVAVHSSMTFKEAEEYLKEMYLNGLFDMDSNEKGQIEYYLRS